MKKLAILGLLALAGGAQAAQLYSNGPVVNSSGLSVLTSPSTTLGVGAQALSGNSVADDFTVTGNGWNVTSLDFFSYQTGSTAFTLTSAVWSIVSGNINGGTVVASGTTSLTDGGLVGYRVSSTTLTNTQRGIYRAQADISDITLSAGTYWLTWSLSGSLASGPWAVPTSDGVLGNAQQSLTGGAYAAIADGGSGVSVELPFVINGSVVAVPEPSSYALMLLGGLMVVGIARRARRG